MTADELKEEYRRKLRERLEELLAETRAIEEALGAAQPAPVPRGWTEERRKAQSRRMKRLHRQGKFKR